MAKKKTKARHKRFEEFNSLSWVRSKHFDRLGGQFGIRVILYHLYRRLQQGFTISDKHFEKALKTFIIELELFEEKFEKKDKNLFGEDA